MINRSNRFHVKEKLSKKKKWNIIDVACGRSAALDSANVLIDINDWSENYPNQSFVVHDLNTKFPFDDNEFDFSFASHILEHVVDPVFFAKELMRISKSGYIEIPTPLFDNLVTAANGDHRSWVFFDDIKKKIVINPRRTMLRNTVDIGELNSLYPFFRESIVIELEWKDSFDIEIGDEIYSYSNNTYDLKNSSISPWILGESTLKS